MGGYVGVWHRPDGGAAVNRDDDTTNRLIAMLDKLADNMDKSKQILDAATKIPMLGVETAIDATGTVKVLNTVAQSTNIFMVRFAIAFLPAGASGLLVLGSAVPVQIPLGAGTTPIPLWLMLNPDDTRQLQSSIVGTMSLTLMGDYLSRSMLYR